MTNDWHHYVPFACLITKENIPENRPALTRLIEQAVVGAVAAAISGYGTFKVMEADIKTLKEQRIEQRQESSAAIRESEARVTAQIQELRRVLLKNKD